MKQQLTVALAIEVTNGRMTLSSISNLFGLDTAYAVHCETIIRSWQPVAWTRRVR